MLPAFLLAASVATLAFALAPQRGLARTAQFAAQQPANPRDGERFDNLVRDEMFAGMAGDAAAFERAMKRCDEALATDPNDAQALVWHGSGLVFQAGQLFRSGDYIKGKEIIIRGFKEMDDAVALAPNNIPVLIPRGASLLSYSKYSRDQERPGLGCSRASRITRRHSPCNRAHGIPRRYTPAASCSPASPRAG